jgi:hypothetical protein
MSASDDTRAARLVLATVACSGAVTRSWASGATAPAVRTLTAFGTPWG